MRNSRNGVLSALAGVGVMVSGMVVSPAVLAGFDEGVSAFENEDYGTALTEFLPLAQAGKVEAMTFLARTYDEGLEAVDKALPWYQKAAAKGDPEAQTRLGQLYDDGEGVEQDTEQAIAWYEKAAAQGDDEAQYLLGLHYDDDLNDNATAAKYYGLAAEQGNTDAEYRLGLLLLGEPGVSRHAVRAWLYLSLAAEAEHEDAGQARDVLELDMKAPELAQAKKMLVDWKAAH